MKKVKLILNSLIIGLMLVSIGYVFYVQFRQAMKVTGEEKVLDPWFYDENNFHNIYRAGYSPNSNYYLITESEYQSRKFKRMGRLLVYTIPAIILLFFLKTRFNSEKDLVKKNENNTSSKDPFSKQFEKLPESQPTNNYSFLILSFIITVIILFLYPDLKKIINNNQIDTIEEVVNVDSTALNKDSVTNTKAIEYEDSSNINPAKIILTKDEFNKIIDSIKNQYSQETSKIEDKKHNSNLNSEEKEVIDFLQEHYDFYDRDHIFRKPLVKKIDTYNYEVSIEECTNKDPFKNDDNFWNAKIVKISRDENGKLQMGKRFY